MQSPDEARLIIEIGERSRRLLDSEDFQWLIDSQTTYNLAALCAAPPGPRGADIVTHHHLQQHALTELVATLRSHVHTGEAMREALDVPEDDEDSD